MKTNNLTILETLPTVLDNDKKVDRIYQQVIADNTWKQAKEILKDCALNEDKGCWRYFGFKCDIFTRTGEFVFALVAVEKAISLYKKKDKERLLVQKAAILYYLRRYEEALQACEQAQRIDPRFILASIQKASILMALLQFKQAEMIFRDVLLYLPQDYQANFNYASCLFETGKLDESEKILLKLDKLQPNRPEPNRLLAKIKARLHGKEEAITFLCDVINKMPNYLPLWEDLLNRFANRGDKERFDFYLAKGEKIFSTSNKLLLIQANFYAHIGFHSEAEVIAKQAISRASTDADGPLTLIQIVLDKGEWQQAGNMLMHLKAMLPKDYRIYALEATIYERLHIYVKAEIALLEAVSLSPRDISLAYRLSAVFAERGKIDESKKILEKIGLLYGETLGLVFNRLVTNTKIAEWSNFEKDLEYVKKEMTLRNGVSLSMLPMYALPDISPFFLKELSDEIAKSFLIRSKEQRKILNFPPVIQKNGKLRIGFGSMDFRKHALSHLMVNIFETMDKNRFEIFAYSYGPDDSSDMRARLINAFDGFYDVRSMSDVAIAQKIANDGIHIFVDLAGYTRWTRAGEICSLRPAPILAHALGYCFTLGEGLVDYMISDQYLAPAKDAEQFFSEKIAYVPCMYPTDPKILPPPPSLRSEHNLPQDAFVFCCFNQAYKIHPKLVDCWTAILSSVPNSVLWIWENLPGVDINLKFEFEARGIDPNRIISGKSVSLEEHYARLQLADLALDTTPYGSGTTSVNALWCGVPLLGFYSDTPSSRGSSSQLHAVGLPELVVEGDFDDYAKRAIHLATHPQELNALRARLKENVAQGSVLFNPSIYTLALQDLFEQMWNRYEEGLPPDHLFANNV
jgi:predicted O-linked N-acetylglucosamine transferase (SPINDLY family)